MESALTHTGESVATACFYSCRCVEERIRGALQVKNNGEWEVGSGFLLKTYQVTREKIFCLSVREAEYMRTTID